MEINFKTIPTINMEATGKWMAQLREEHGYSRTNLGKAMSVSVQAVCKWEKGINLPTIDNAVILAELYDIKLDDLFVLNGPHSGDDNPEGSGNRIEFVA